MNEKTQTDGHPTMCCGQCAATLDGLRVENARLSDEVERQVKARHLVEDKLIEAQKEIAKTTALLFDALAQRERLSVVRGLCTTGGE